MRERWHDEGWLHLAGFFDERATGAVDALIDDLWRSRPASITVDDLDRKQRTRMARLDPEQRHHRIKLNDLYLAYPLIRDTLLEPRLVAIVRELLGDEPVLCNSLNLERSSAQEYHADSLYMTPRTPERLVAVWVALEDVTPGSGPLRLYPGSHRLDPYVFSNGTRHAVTEELPRWAEHMQTQLDAKGMQPHVVYAKRGDVVLWHSDLLHGAESPEPQRTRRSLVAHYFAKSDCERARMFVAGEIGRCWVKRPAQPADLRGRIAGALQRRWYALRAR